MLEESTMKFVVREMAFHFVKHLLWHLVSTLFEFLIRFGVIVTIEKVYYVLLRRFQINLFVINVLKGVYENIVYFMHIRGYLLMNYCGC